MAYLKISILLIFAFFSPQIDLWISSMFYNHGFQDNFFLTGIYLFGPIPAWVIAIGAFVAFFIPKYRHLRSIFLYLIIVLAIGSGLIVHAAFKENWGRPRPKQVVEFGGNDQFRPFYSPNFKDDVKHRSFASGHVTTGFFFFSIYFIGRSLKRKDIQNLGLFLSFFLGILLTYARVAQGGHFFTDAVASLIVMWYTSLFFSPMLEYERPYAKTS